MTVIAHKYNPGFLTDDELVASFCVRTTEFEMSIETLRDCTGPSNPHQIVIGPRGSGKTSLLLRIAAEVRRDVGLAADFFPVVFAEESYEVATAGEFWLECLSHLAVQAPRQEDDPDLSRTFEELRTIRDDRELADRCIGTLLDFSDRVGKRLVLMVENLDMMFRDMTDPDAGWRLRTVLQTEPRIILFASAISRFDEIDDPKHALYEQFSGRTLRPLDTDECATLWEAVAGQCPPPGTIRSLQILTGGSPRLLTIVARFGAELSFQKLMASLLDLVDDHTEYFKSHLEALPAQERRVYLALAVLWKPATTREIATQARIDTSKCSAQLTRLVERGAVRSAGGSARRKQYYLTERLYNIYYLLRRSRRSDRLVEALIHFMEVYYSPSELMDIGARIIREAKSFGSEMLWLPQTALSRLMALPALAGYREELQAMITEGSGESLGRGLVFADTSREIEADIKLDGHGTDYLHQSTDEKEERAAKKLFDKAVALDKQNQTKEALTAYGEVMRQFGESRNPDVLTWLGSSLSNRIVIFERLGRDNETIATCDELDFRLRESKVSIDRQRIVQALVMKGLVLHGQGRTVDALAVCDEVDRRFGDNEIPGIVESVMKSLTMKPFVLYELDRMEDALSTCDEIMCRLGGAENSTLFDQGTRTLVCKGALLTEMNRLDDALTVLDEAVGRFEDSKSPALFEWIAAALCFKGWILKVMDRPKESLAVYDELVRRFGDSESSALRGWAKVALLVRVDIESGCRRYEAADRTAGQALDLLGISYPELQVRAHLSRARALVDGDPSGCEREIEAALALLPEIDSPPKRDIDSLMLFSVELGLERMCELIKASPATNFLLPLTTALELELGLEPRVAQEVREVAEDIQQELMQLRESGTVGTDGKRVENIPVGDSESQDA